jgi:propanol-preferring alcohol dehydrogenase
MPLRHVLKKNLTVRSNQTGKKSDIEEALRISASGKIICETEILRLRDLNAALDRVEKGDVLGKLIIDLQSEIENPRGSL